jgi:hypothetical protein
MSRIVDRIRIQIDLADRLDRGELDLDYLPARRERADAELCALEWRSSRVRLALTLLYLALCAFIGTSLTLAIDVLLGSHFMGLPTLMAVVGVTLLLWASTNLSLEAHRAMRSNHDEVLFHRALIARRAADRGAGPPPGCAG